MSTLFELTAYVLMFNAFLKAYRFLKNDPTPDKPDKGARENTDKGTRVKELAHQTVIKKNFDSSTIYDFVRTPEISQNSFRVFLRYVEIHEIPFKFTSHVHFQVNGYLLSKLDASEENLVLFVAEHAAMVVKYNNVNRLTMGSTHQFQKIYRNLGDIEKIYADFLKISGDNQFKVQLTLRSGDTSVSAFSKVVPFDPANGEFADYIANEIKRLSEKYNLKINVSPLTIIVKSLVIPNTITAGKNN